jgi:hypothetical protein
MMNLLLRGIAVLAMAAAVNCNRSADQADPIEASASLAGPESVGNSAATAEAEPPNATEMTETLPSTASVLPLVLSVAVASLGGALIARCVRRPIQ